MTLQTIGQRWAEDAALVTEAPGRRNDYGEWVAGDTSRTDIRPVTAPPNTATMREVLPEGTRLEDARTFWLDGPDIAPVHAGAQGAAADVIEYQGTRFRVHMVQDWRPHAGLEIHAIREESQ